MVQRKNILERRRNAPEPIATQQPAKPEPEPKVSAISKVHTAAATPPREDVQISQMRVNTKTTAHNRLKSVSGHLGLTLQDFAVVAINRLLRDLHTGGEITLDEIAKATDIDPSSVDNELLGYLTRVQLTLPSKIGKEDDSPEK